MNLTLRGSLAVWGFVILAALAFWGSRAAWATSNQSPAHQTVPTRVKSPTPGPPTNTPVPPANTPIPPRAATALPSPTAPASSTPLPAKTAVLVAMATAKENLRIRSAPSTGAAVMGQLKKGDTVQIVGRSPASDWWQVPLPTNPNARGWIAAEFTATNGPMESVPVIRASTASAIAATPTILVEPTDTLLPSTSATPARAEILPPPTNTPSISVAPIAEEESAESSNLLVTIVVGVVLLGIGGGFVLIMLGGVIYLLGRS